MQHSDFLQGQTIKINTKLMRQIKIQITKKEKLVSECAQSCNCQQQSFWYC